MDNFVNPSNVDYDNSDEETLLKLRSLVNAYNENPYYFSLTESVFIEAYKRGVEVEALSLKDGVITSINDQLIQNEYSSDLSGRSILRTNFPAYYAQYRTPNETVINHLLNLHDDMVFMASVNRYKFEKFREGDAVEYDVTFTYQGNNMTIGDGLEFFRTFQASEMLPVIIYVDGKQSVMVKALSSRDGKPGEYENFSPSVSSIVSKENPPRNTIYFYFKTGRAYDDISKPSTYRYQKEECNLVSGSPIRIRSRFGRVDMKKALQDTIGDFEITMTDVYGSLIVSFYDIEVDWFVLRSIMAYERTFSDMFYVNDTRTPFQTTAHREFYYYPRMAFQESGVSDRFDDGQVRISFQQVHTSSTEAIYLGDDSRNFPKGTRKARFEITNIKPFQVKEAIYNSLSRLISFYDSEMSKKYFDFINQSKLVYLSKTKSSFQNEKGELDISKKVAFNSLTLMRMLEERRYYEIVPKEDWVIFGEPSKGIEPVFPRSIVFEGVLISSKNKNKPYLFIEDNGEYIVCSRKKLTKEVFDARLSEIVSNDVVSKTFDFVSELIGVKSIRGRSVGSNLNETFSCSVYDAIKNNTNILDNVECNNFVSFMLDRVEPECLKQELFDINEDQILESLKGPLKWDRHLRLIEEAFGINLYVFGIPPGNRKPDILKPRCRGCYIRSNKNRKCLVVVVEKFKSLCRTFCSSELLDEDIDRKCSDLFNQKFGYDVFLSEGVARNMFRDQTVLGKVIYQSLDRNGKCSGIITKYRGKEFGIILKYYVQPFNAKSVEVKRIYEYMNSEEEILSVFGENGKARNTRVEYVMFSVISGGRRNNPVSAVEVRKNLDIFTELLVLTFRVLSYVNVDERPKYLKLLRNSDSSSYDFSELPSRIPISNYRRPAGTQPSIEDYFQLLNKLCPSISDGKKFLIRGEGLYSKVNEIYLPKLLTFEPNSRKLMESIYIKTIISDIRKFTRPNTITFSNESDYLKIMRSNLALSAKTKIHLNCVLSYQPFIYDDSSFVFLVQNISRKYSSRMNVLVINSALKVCLDWKNEKINYGHETATEEDLYRTTHYIEYAIDINGKIFQKNMYNRKRDNNTTTDPCHILYYEVNGKDNYFSLLPF